MIKFIFRDWRLEPAAMDSQQFDHDAIKLVVEGELPEGWQWLAYITHGADLNAITFTRETEGGVTTLTHIFSASELCFTGTYTLQLLGTLDGKRRHTNVENFRVPKSVTGEGHWPELPTIIEETLSLAAEAAGEAQVSAATAVAAAETTAADADRAAAAAQSAEQSKSAAEYAASSAASSASSAFTAQEMAKNSASSASRNAADAVTAADTASSAADRAELAAVSALESASTAQDSSAEATAAAEAAAAVVAGIADKIPGKVTWTAKSHPATLNTAPTNIVAKITNCLQSIEDRPAEATKPNGTFMSFNGDTKSSSVTGGTEGYGYTVQILLDFDGRMYYRFCTRDDGSRWSEWSTMVSTALLTSSIGEVTAALNSAVTEINASVAASIAEVNATIAADIAEVNATMAADIARVNENIEAAYNELHAEIEDATYDLTAAIPFGAEFAAFSSFGIIGDSMSVGAYNVGESHSRHTDGSWGRYIADRCNSRPVWLGKTAWTTADFLATTEPTSATDENGRVDYIGLNGAQRPENICDAYIIGLGINDAGTSHHVDLADYADNMAQIVAELLALNPAARIFILTNPTSRDSMADTIEQYNAALRSLVTNLADRRVHLVDLFDRHHDEYKALEAVTDAANAHYTTPTYFRFGEIMLADLCAVMREHPLDFYDIPGKISTNRRMAKVADYTVDVSESSTKFDLDRPCSELFIKMSYVSDGVSATLSVQAYSGESAQNYLGRANKLTQNTNFICFVNDNFGIRDVRSSFNVSDSNVGTSALYNGERIKDFTKINQRPITAISVGVNAGAIGIGTRIEVWGC